MLKRRAVKAAFPLLSIFLLFDS